MKCPYCIEREHEGKNPALGLVKAEECVVGSLWLHKSCGKVLIVTEVSGPFFKVRLATEEEKRNGQKQAGVLEHPT